ncbi:MAG: DUF4915 domain-containing protein [Isosphaeraceae bacterium]|nr:DUF4915 domain-containing protein [Isosphaeraceae bacterium]
MTSPNRDSTKQRRLDALSSLHNEQWRDQAQVAAHWSDAGQADPRLFEYRVEGNWWETLAESTATLLVTREYEHLVMALRADHSGGRISYMSLPHPSGLVADRRRNVVHVASTRNPNQIFDLAPVAGVKERLDAPSAPAEAELVPVRSRFFPGCLYLHDLALIDEALHGNAVGENAVVRFDSDGGAYRVWWPSCIEHANGPVFGRNHLQLNSIAAGDNLSSSYFSASASRIGRYRPGHLKFAVDRTGVIFSGKTREPFARGLTRPHSARLNQGVLWVDNSGYGEVGIVRDGGFEPIARLPGWTRGLCFRGDVAFVGTSRVIPRFRSYAPGLDVEASLCGLHALDVRTGQVRGSLIWPWGNQIFAIDWLPRDVTGGFPWLANRKRPTRTKRLFYAYTTATNP